MQHIRDKEARNNLIKTGAEPNECSTSDMGPIEPDAEEISTIFRIAEKVVRDNVRTIFIGANPRIWSMGYGITRNHTPHSLRKRLLPQHKLAAATYMTACGCQHQRLGKYRDALGGVYDFTLLRKLPSLERLVVMIKNQNLNWLPKLSEIEQRVRLAIMAAQAAYPDIKTPELQLEYIDNWHTCGK
ncbi:hypothetical protein WAI453_006359 [Rhynchosporium graminicola]